MQRALFSIAIFGLSFLISSQLLQIFRGEGTLLAWALVVAGAAGFVWILRSRRRSIGGTQQ